IFIKSQNRQFFSFRIFHSSHKKILPLDKQILFFICLPKGEHIKIDQNGFFSNKFMFSLHKKV
ncbi:hypothetical protein C4A76_26570, partial [Brevibacillus laterosporus]